MSRILPRFSMRAPLLAATLCTSLGVVSAATFARAQQTSASESQPAEATWSNAPSSAATTTAAQAQALLHYERGRAYYAAGRYRNSINELQTAIRLDPEGFNLYFDLGLVYERVAMPEEALSAYRMYLVHISDAAERERTERIIARVHGARVELQDVRVRRGLADAWFWGFTGGAGVSTVTGTVLLIAAARQPGVPGTDSLVIAGTTGLALGAGLGITAALLYFTRETPLRNIPRCVHAATDGRSASLQFQLSF